MLLEWISVIVCLVHNFLYICRWEKVDVFGDNIQYVNNMELFTRCFVMICCGDRVIINSLSIKS